jgi:hypothetical protein
VSLTALVILVCPVVVFAASRAEHGIASALWGGITLLFFVPAGALLAMISSDGHALFAVLMALVVLSGIVTGGALLFLANRRRQRRVAPVQTIGRLTLVHHALVLAVVGTALAVSGNGEASELATLLAMLAVPCLVGAYLGWRLLVQPTPIS